MTTDDSTTTWSYESSLATCIVRYQGRSEKWQSQSMYISDRERVEVPQMLLDKIKVTVRRFGPVLEDYDDGA